MQTPIYDFEQLLKQFNEMSNDEIMEEYATVHVLWRHYLDNAMWTEFEQLDQAHDFLGHYLAQMICSNCGYDIGCN